MHGEGKGDRVIEGKRSGDSGFPVLSFYDWAITRS